MTWNRYQTSNGPRAKARCAPVVCHVPAVPRLSSFERGSGKGNNGVPPGVSGFGWSPTAHDQFAHDTGRLHECPHPACEGEVCRRVRRGRCLGRVPRDWPGHLIPIPAAVQE